MPRRVNLTFEIGSTVLHNFCSFWPHTPSSAHLATDTRACIETDTDTNTDVQPHRETDKATVADTVRCHCGTMSSSVALDSRMTSTEKATCLAIIRKDRRGMGRGRRREWE